MNEEILTAYDNRKAEILAHLKTLEKYVKANSNTPKKELNWGHVGTIGYIEDELHHLSDMINHTGEYAE